MTVNKLTYPAKENAVQEKINEIIDNMAGTITVDQTYDGTSTNPQSGVAIAGAKFLQNTATGTNSITIEGSSTSQNSAINIGLNTSVTNYGGLAIGYYAQSSGSRGIAIGVGTSGYGVKAIGTNTTSIGLNSVATGNYSIAIGNSAKSTGNNSIAIGTNKQEAGTSTVAINGMARGDHCVAINGGVNDIASYCTAIGSGAEAGFGTLGNNSSIQLGYGTNKTSNSFSVGFYNDANTHYNWQLLDGTTGLIPDARISTNIARTSDIPAAQVNSDWNANSGVAEILNKPSLSTVATSGDYSDLINTPTIDQTFDGTSANAQSGVSILGLLEAIYPIGSIYIGTTSTCPMSALFGTWTLVAQDKALWTGDGTNADTTIAAGLPNIKGGLQSGGVAGSTWDSNVTAVSGAFTKSGSSSYASRGTNLASGSYSIRADFNAANSNSIYSDDATTVQPPAYVVNVWKRTA